MSWTLDLIRRFGDRMTLPSIWRYREFLMRHQSGGLRNQECVLTLTFRKPVRVTFCLRESTTDFETMDEILFEEVYRDIATYVPACRTLIDLGANIGLATLYFGGLYPETSVFAVEPEGSNFALLKRNVRELTASGRCRILQAGVWSEDRPLRIHAERENSFNRFQTRPAEESSLTIPGVSMNSILQHSGFEFVDLLKIDIEGAEVELFRGDLSWMPRVRALAVEFHGDAREKSGFDALMVNRRVLQLNSHTVLAIQP